MEKGYRREMGSIGSNYSHVCYASYRQGYRCISEQNAEISEILGNQHLLIQQNPCWSKFRSFVSY